MAPVLEQVVEDLKATIAKLENRIAHLEGNHGSSQGSTEGVRMILIGPPGAGELIPVFR
jgi:adenylate kinase